MDKNGIIYEKFHWGKTSPQRNSLRSLAQDTFPQLNMPYTKIGGMKKDTAKYLVENKSMYDKYQQGFQSCYPRRKRRY